MNMRLSHFGPVMLDVLGVSLTADDIRRLQHRLVGGVILFGRNFQNRAQLCALTAAIDALRPGMLIAVDHEGGRVQRFRSDGFTRLPAMRKLGQLWQHDVLQATKAATATGFVLAAELRACGIGMSFTPVLDLDFGQSSVIGDRAFDSDPRVVTLLAKSLNHGLLLAGMANCGKHFPGHGFAQADSHVAMPLDQRSLPEILEHDARPYEWLGMSLSAVMPAHVIYPKVDSHPAGFSKKWLSILREQLGFQGAIFSDDLSMQGASVAGDAVQRAQAALRAGCDMVLMCNAPQQLDLLLAGLPDHDCESTEAARAAPMSRMSRIAALLPRAPACTWDQLQHDGAYQAARQIVQALSNADQA